MATHFTRIGSPYRPHTIYEKITHEMAPSGSLVAYFIDKNGEIIADIIRFRVEVQFQNSVCIFFPFLIIAFVFCLFSETIDIIGMFVLIPI